MGIPIPAPRALCGPLGQPLALPEPQFLSLVSGGVAFHHCPKHKKQEPSCHFLHARQKATGSCRAERSPPKAPRSHGCWGQRGWPRALAPSAERGGRGWLGLRGAAGEVPVHHRNGPFAMIGCPGVNNANGIGRVNSVTRLNRRNMQRSARVSINQPRAALRGRQDLKFRSGDGYSHNPSWRGNLFCLYLFTARQGWGAGPSTAILHLKY